jgi:hypothetical protein
MSKKHWISVKRGLSEDPKHRESMGMAIWGFLHMIDRADWETGKVFDWRDKDEAEDMGVNERTLRDWRQRLAEGGYIACDKKQRGLEITIFNWINPREYSAGVLNPKILSDTTSDMSVSVSEILSDTTFDTRFDTGFRGESVTPTLDSEIKSQRSIETPTPDFTQMTVIEARKWPTLKLYTEATDYFPGSVVWKFVDQFILENHLTSEKIHEAAVAWVSTGYNQANVKGILEWAAYGIPENKAVKIATDKPLTELQKALKMIGAKYE